MTTRKKSNTPEPTFDPESKCDWKIRDALRFACQINTDDAVYSILKNITASKLWGCLKYKDPHIYLPIIQNDNNTILDMFFNHLGETWISYIKLLATNLYPFIFEHGSLEVFKILDRRLDRDKTWAIISADDFKNYKLLLNHSNIEMIKMIHRKLGKQFVHKAIQSNDCKLYLEAVKNSEIAIIQELNKQLGPLHTKHVVIRAGDYFYAPRFSWRGMLTCLSSHYHYSSFIIACKTGNFELVKLISSLMGDSHTKNAITARHYISVINACETGNITLVKYLHEHIGNPQSTNVNDSIRAWDYTAYSRACRSGNLALVDYLDNILKKDRDNALKSLSFYAIVASACSGNVALLKRNLQRLKGEGENPFKNQRQQILQGAKDSNSTKMIDYVNKILKKEQIISIAHPLEQENKDDNSEEHKRKTTKALIAKQGLFSTNEKPCAEKAINSRAPSISI